MASAMVGCILSGASLHAADLPIEISDSQASLIQNTTVAAAMSGPIRSVSVREGDVVEVDQTLVQLDDSVAETEFDAARAAARAAQIEAENDVDSRYAKRTLEVRRQELELSQSANTRFPGSVPATEIEKLRLVVDQSELSIEQAQHEQRIARAKAAEKMSVAEIAAAKLRRHRIAAPVAGTVVQIDAKTGQWTEPGEPLVRIVSLDPIRIECFVDATATTDSLVGKTAAFHLTGGNGDSSPRLGTVVFVSPEFNAVTGQTKLWAEVANPDGRIQPGMRGRLVIGP